MRLPCGSAPGRACSQRRRERSQRPAARAHSAGVSEHQRTDVLGSVMIAVRRRQREIKGDVIFHHVRSSEPLCRWVHASLIDAHVDAEGQVSSCVTHFVFRNLRNVSHPDSYSSLRPLSGLDALRSRGPQRHVLRCPSARKRWSVLFVHVVRAPRLGSPTSGRERVISALSRRHHVPLSIHQRRRPPTRPPTRPPIRRPRPSPEPPSARRPPWPVYGEPPKPRSLSWP